MDILPYAAQKQKETIPNDCVRKSTDQPDFFEDPIQATFGKTRVRIGVNIFFEFYDSQVVFKVAVDFVGAHTERRALHFGLIIEMVQSKMWPLDCKNSRRRGA